MISFAHLLSHLAASGCFGFGIYYTLFRVEVPEKLAKEYHITDFGGWWKYFTVWNMVVQFVFFTVAALNDLFGSDAHKQKKVSTLQKTRDTIFAVLAFPAGMFVQIGFWSLFIIDRQLIYSEIMETFIPSWLNHVMHSICLPLVAIELFLSFHHYPQRFKGCLVVGAFICAYLSWTLVIAQVGGFWVYPIMKKLNWWQQVLFQVGCAVVLIVFYLIGEQTNQAIWVKKKQPKAVKQQQNSDAKSKKKRKTK